MPEITVLYDNTTLKKKLVPAWGFAARVKHRGRTILFDTGGKADLLLANMKALRISPRSITDIFISHHHWDHTGGLFGFLTMNHKVNIYVPASVSRAYRREIRASGAKCVGIKNLTMIGPGIYSSGEIGQAIKEQCLVVAVPDGLVMITGCSHPGIVKMAGWVKNQLKQEISLIIGGFHLGALPVKAAEKVVAELKKLGVKRLAPSHCTGIKSIGLFKKAYQERYIKCGVGQVIR
jgi:7,8-dihydropterin-6-yl-methyl-4-(beta-D-ribofuranosyl)aminobenzene 5'-phosphate synthase